MILRFSIFFVALSLLINSAAAKPRIALWNPETISTSSRFDIDLDWLDQVAKWLQESDIETARLTAEQWEDAETFSATKFDALILPGDAFPRHSAPALQRFAAEGGVLISLGAAPAPFLIAIEQPPDGNWTPSPVTPDKGWESSEIYSKVLGLVYNDVPERRDDGVRHETTALFKKYLPESLASTILEKKLPSRWLVPRIGTSLYPLIRSRRADGSDSVPQIFIVQNKIVPNKTAAENQTITQSGIVAVSKEFTQFQAESKQIVVALAKIAADLKSGALQLAPDDKMELRDDTPGELPIER